MMAGIAERFNAAARDYQNLADPQRESAEAVLGMIPASAAPVTILDAGCGTGILTEGLLRRFPSAAVTGLDISPAMLEEAKFFLDAEPRLTWHLGSLEELPAGLRFGCVASNAALHWMGPLSPLFTGVAQRLSPGGLLVCGLMLKGTLAELHQARQTAAPTVPVLAALPSLDDVVEAIQAAGLIVRVAREMTVVAWHAGAAEMMRCLHRQGVTGGRISHGRRLLGRAELRAVADEYDRCHGCARGVPATYRMGLVRAQCP